MRNHHLQACQAVNANYGDYGDQSYGYGYGYGAGGGGGIPKRLHTYYRFLTSRLKGFQILGESHGVLKMWMIIIIL